MMLAPFALLCGKLCHRLSSFGSACLLKNAVLKRVYGTRVCPGWYQGAPRPRRAWRRRGDEFGMLMVGTEPRTQNLELRTLKSRTKPPKATSKPSQSLLIANRLRPQSHLNASPMRPQSYLKATPKLPQSSHKATLKHSAL